MSIGHSWLPVDLGPVLSGQWKPAKPTVGRRSDNVGIFYPGKLHTISSESEAGKTWLALVAVFEELRAGNHVCYIDFEDDEGGVVGRLLALQADPEWIRERFHYIRPTKALSDDDVKDLATTIIGHQPTLAVIDGITEAMAMHGLNPSDNKDIVEFSNILPRKLANAGCATVCLDHVPKSTENRGRYAIGGVHKLNGLDGAAFTMESREPFGIGITGRSSIMIAKDRPGQLRKHGYRLKNGLDAFADLIITSHDESYCEFEIRPATERTEQFRPTILMAKISAALKDHGPLSLRRIIAAVGGKRDYVIKALDLLILDGYVSEKTPHELLKPFVESGDSA